MIFKRFFTWLGWGINLPLRKEKWIVFVAAFGPILASVIVAAIIPLKSDIVIHFTGSLGIYCGLLALISSIYSDPKRNWRITLDKIEERAEEPGFLQEFENLFAVLKDETRRTQEPAKLKEFVELAQQLKNERETIAELEQELRQKSNQQWIDKEIANLKKQLKFRAIALPALIGEQNTIIHSIRVKILNLVKDR